jgi:MFS family permease
LARSRPNLEVSRGAPEHAQLPIQEATQTQWLQWLIAVAFFMESLDTTILNTGVPAIAAALHVKPLSMILVIAVMVYIFGALTKVQYAGMNTLTYADVPGSRASGASSIASTLQQMSISFGVAFAGLMAGIFLPKAGVENCTGMLQGLHASFLILGGYTIISSAIFYQLRTGDAVGRKPATE